MKNNHKKSLVIISIMGVIFLFGSFIATQLTASGFQFNKKLGYLYLSSFHLYNPFAFWVWVYRYGEVRSLTHHFSSGWQCIAITSIIILSIAIWVNLRTIFDGNEADSHGSAHFASQKDISNSGLLDASSDPSVYIGAYRSELTGKISYLQDSSSTHVFVFAPSRSGKGVGLILPTLLSYPSSVIISDFKLENWHLTSGYRKSIGHKVLKFDLTCSDGSSAQFNPLREIRRGQNEVRDAQLIADMLVDPEGKGANDHWANSANSLLVSTILHVLYTESDKSLAGVRAFLSNPSCSEKETFELMLEAANERVNSESSMQNVAAQSNSTFLIIASGAREMLNKSDAERSSIISSTLTFLKLYRDPIMASNTRGHDFFINDLVNYEVPVSLYLGIPPSDIARTMPFMRLMLQMILSRLTETLEINPVQLIRRQLLLMLDEFPQFGRLPFFEKTLSYTAGYNIRAYLISQDMQQIYREYGRDQSIVSNCGIRIAYAPNTLETAKYLSEALGSKTLKQKHVNYSGQRFEWLLRNVSVSEHNIKRCLLMPDELMRLPHDAALIFKNGMAPIYGAKIYYYNDKIFSERSDIFPPEKSDELDNKKSHAIACNDKSLSPAGENDLIGEYLTWTHKLLENSGE